MVGASNTLDPIAAAEADIAGSKDLIAAVSRDLGQHERWLAHYHVAERRHARRVMVRELLYRIEVARQSLMRLLERISLRILHAAKLVALFLWRTGAALLARLSRVAKATLDWCRPRAYALVLLLVTWLTALAAWTIATANHLANKSWDLLAAFAVWLAATVSMVARTLWTWLGAFAVWAVATASRLSRELWRWLSRFAVRTAARSRVMSRIALKRAAIGASSLAQRSRLVAGGTERGLARLWRWSYRQSQTLIRNSVERGSASAAWTAAHSRTSMHALQKRIAAASHRLDTDARTLSRAAFAAGSSGIAWSVSRVRSLASGAKRPAEPDANHRALVVRRCTALISIEPRRNRLPALHAN